MLKHLSHVPFRYVPFLSRDAILLRSVLTKLNSVVIVRKGTVPTEQPPLVGAVPNFAGRGCCVVSATNSHGR
jgi:hypothetical protein